MPIRQGYFAEQLYDGNFPAGYTYGSEGALPSASSGGEADPGPPVAGLSIHTFPVTVAGRIRTGYVEKGTFDDIYNHIHVYPQSISLGNLANAQVRTATVWNAFVSEFKTLSAAQINGDLGSSVTLPAGVTLPFEVPPLRALDFVITVGMVGSYAIDAAFAVTIEGESYEIPITGTRIVLFPFAPNWASAVDETLQHLTILETSYTGKEQVSEIREEPRRVLQYNFRIHTDAANLFDNVMFGWTARLFCVPLWQEKTKLTADAAIGAMLLSLDTNYRTFQAGSQAILFNDIDDYEVVEVASATASSITLVRPLDGAWPTNTRVYPAMTSAIDADLATSRQSDTHIDGVVRFTVNPADNFPRMDQVAAPQTYRGYELYTKTTNWIAGLNTGIGARQTLADNSEGIFRITRRTSFPLIQRGFRWLLRSRQDAEFVRQFLARRRGRLKPVWIASGMRDFVLLENASSFATAIVVKDNKYGSFVDLHAARRDILIQLRNGTFIARRITSYALDIDGNAVITIDSALGVDLTPAAVKKISYLGFYRLASDEITFSWHTNTVASVETNFVLKESP